VSDEALFGNVSYKKLFKHPNDLKVRDAFVGIFSDLLYKNITIVNNISRVIRMTIISDAVSCDIVINPLSETPV
jgi:hypothetical protein